MKTVILAGGFGTRLSEETIARPKPMVEVGGRPILWHIMKTYSFFGFNEFVIALGYRADMIKRYFLDYSSLNGDLTVKLNKTDAHIEHLEHDPWTIHLKDTGYHSNTGGRLKLLKNLIGDEPFMLTYGDGVSNINIPDLLRFHKKHGKMVTLSAVRPPARFGGLNISENGEVCDFSEKSQMDAGWISGGFMVCDPKLLDHIDDATTSLEKEVLEKLAQENQLMAYKHRGFWQCMDTVRDMHYLEHLWTSGKAPWKLWDDSIPHEKLPHFVESTISYEKTTIL